MEEVNATMLESGRMLYGEYQAALQTEEVAVGVSGAESAAHAVALAALDEKRCQELRMAQDQFRMAESLGKQAVEERDQEIAAYNWSQELIASLNEATVHNAQERSEFHQTVLASKEYQWHEEHEMAIQELEELQH